MSLSKPVCDKDASTCQSVTGIAQSLVAGLLKSNGGAGVSEFSKIFPAGDPSYFDPVYKQIDKIVDKKVTPERMVEMNNLINDAKNCVEKTYMKAKASYTQNLSALISPQVSKLRSAIDRFINPVNLQPGSICAFMICAGVHLALLQEIITLHESATDDCASNLQMLLTLYAHYAKDTTNGILQARKKKIEAKSETIENVCKFWFEDLLTEHRSQDWINTVNDKCKAADATKRRDDAMKAYTQQQITQLTKDMSDPAAISAEWFKLEKSFGEVFETGTS